MSATTTGVEMVTLPNLNNRTLAGEFDSTQMHVEADEAARSSMGIESSERDPLLLRNSIIGPGELEQLRSRKSKDGKKVGKKLTAFYEDQNNHIENLLKPMALHTSDALQTEEDNAFKVKLAIRLSFYANIALAILQLYAAASSLSLSLFATAIDSVFDPFANYLLNVLHKKSLSADEKKWPMGGSRFETSDGNIVYGALMGMVNLILIVESIRSLASHTSDEDTNKLHIPSLVAVGVAFFTKFCLFLYCYAIKSHSSQVEVLWEDHRNDLFINGFGIFSSAAGAKIRWWIDPAGAMIIATGVIIVWTRTIYSEFLLLAGKAAPVEFQQLIVYKCMTFSPEIKAIDTCRVYHSGPDYFVEVDIVLDGDMPLCRAHDIAQLLQDTIEKLSNVDRCFIHVDFETSHSPEHRKTK